MVLIQFTRASFDEQKTAYWTLVDIVLAGGDGKLLLGNTTDAFKSCVPSVERFVLVSKNNHLVFTNQNKKKIRRTFCIPFFNWCWYN